MEWHVDYWNRLKVGGAGSWRDPFSDPSFTERQRRYNHVLRGTTSVYTPQAVIAGKFETVGSRAGEIDSFIRKATAQKGPVISFRNAKGALFARLPDEVLSHGNEVRLVRFYRQAETRIGGGENHGRNLAEAHVVRAETVLEPDEAGAVEFAAPVSGEGCAVVIYNEAALAQSAAYCP